MKNVVVLNVVGLSGRLIGEHTPYLSKLGQHGSQHAIKTITPAVTCSVQATLTTGLLPRDHGIVGNGWYFRDVAEVAFWRQSAHLYQGERIWEAAKRRDASFTSAKLFWWYNMYDNADWCVTPRPMYPADGRKIPDIWTHPAALRDELNQELGSFPLFSFWGPKANIVSSRWIADCAKRVFDTRKPNLTLVYLPHLDYCLQKYGPTHPAIPAELRAVDALCGELSDHFSARGATTLVLSEYAITPVRGPIHVNRALREAGLLALREEMGRELLDAGASAAFAVADHQIAHVYVKDRARVSEVQQLLQALPGVDRALDAEGKQKLGLDHSRSGELVLLSAPDRWFSYYYWLDPDRAPDYARTVDIHRKPGYDPVELFLDPEKALLPVRVAFKLAQRKLGFRTLLDVIPLDADLVKGSHGLAHDDPLDSPVLISSEPLELDGPLAATAVKGLVLDQLFKS